MSISSRTTIRKLNRITLGRGSSFIGVTLESEVGSLALNRFGQAGQHMVLLLWTGLGAASLGHGECW